MKMISMIDMLSWNNNTQNIDSDAALREFLKQLHARSEFKFICSELDENHLFIFHDIYDKRFENVEQWLQYVSI